MNPVTAATPSALVRIATQTALAALGAYWLGLQLTSTLHEASADIGALWSAISAIVVLQATQRDTLNSAWLRILGTLIGAVISASYLSLLPFNPLGMAASIFITVLLCHAARIPDHARLAAITVAVIMVAANLSPDLPPIQNAALRFIESCIGAALGTLAALLWPEPRSLSDSRRSGCKIR